MVQRRFTETVDIRQQSLDTERARASLTLADKLSEFKNLGMQKLEEQAIARGQKRAQETELKKEGGITQTPKFDKEIPFLGTIEAKAHNTALRNAYVASLDTDIRETVSRIALENQDNLQKFNDTITGAKNGFIQSVDPTVRQIVQNEFDSQISYNRLKIQENVIKQQKQAAIDTIATNVEGAKREAIRLTRNGETRQAASEVQKTLASMDGLVEADPSLKGKVSEAKIEFLREVNEQHKRFEIDAVADNKGLQAARDEISKLASGKVPQGWEPDQWDAFTTSLTQDINRRESRLKKQVVEIDKAILKQESVDRGLRFLDPSIPADPAKSSQDRKDVNNAFDQMSKQWAITQTPEQQFNSTVDFIKRTGIIPDKVISNTNAVMRSGNENQVLNYSLFIDELQKKGSANVIADIPSDARAISMMISDSISIGTDPSVAVEIARTSTYGIDNTKKEAIKNATNKFLQEKPQSLQDFAEVYDVKFFGEEPDVSAAMQAEYNVAFANYMQMTDANTDQSAKLAFQDLKKFWSVTSVGEGGKRFEKFTPEAMYAIQDVDNDWMQEVFEADVKSLGKDPKNVTISFDKESVSKNQPSWILLEKDENGIYQHVFNQEGELLRWFPDFKESEKYKKEVMLGSKQRQQIINESAEVKALREEMQEVKRFLGTNK